MITMVYKPIYYDRYKSTSLGGGMTYSSPWRTYDHKRFFFEEVLQGTGPQNDS